MKVFENKTVVITGGTGSLGKVLAERLLSQTAGRPKKIIIFSRDEAKQQALRTAYWAEGRGPDQAGKGSEPRSRGSESAGIGLGSAGKGSDSVGKKPDLPDRGLVPTAGGPEPQLEFRIGDVRDYHAVCSVLAQADIVVNAAALKQVPSCEYFPFEAVQTNIIGAENIIRAIRENSLKVETVVGVSTDKACKPVNAMGISKAMQERIFIAANLALPATRFVCVRYGNVLASRGSVIPLFHEQISRGGPVTLTTREMTRFLLPLTRAVDTIEAVIAQGRRGEIFVPAILSARMADVAQALIGDKKISVIVTGIRPGEKIHEILVSEEEAARTYQRGDHYAITSMLPELGTEEPGSPVLGQEYSSKDYLMTAEETRELLQKHGLLALPEGFNRGQESEMLR
ncbi:Polysaccharide biosynthesis protein [Acididesulfobacillus acetoxydans]|uniref:Polysaccharide biosynthesis protein n=1 Tax=Acididesulfobacillus acetoxydans TaxID=1561005 RepID=A0A8S0W239_9FIRM|nr:polysaccharide biosynthesis protein [Acididesulfobacillus acetoxydans]CAA7600338.1 Polysaccharide biosynthesis protein [Acididesulfobacillus acetoxydans]CEJ07860.1 UDP-glucose 4-epimerase [Acididesulfobacillus acetoxydans]